MEEYDPNIAPDAAEWLALSELDRVGLVEAFHEQAGGFGENLRLHATVHTVVENQLALGDPLEAQIALSRLRAGGLTRHESLHAVGSVLAEFLFPILKAQADPPEFDVSGYRRSLSELTVARWRDDG